MKIISKKFFSLFIATVILILTVSNSYNLSNNVNKVHAASIAAVPAVEYGGIALWKIIAGVLASCGVYEVYENSADIKEALNNYFSYESMKNGLIADADTVIQVYDQITGREYDCYWSDKIFDFDSQLNDEVQGALEKYKTAEERAQAFRDGLLSSEAFLLLDDYVFTPTKELYNSVCDWVEALINGETTCEIDGKSLINTDSLSMHWNGEYERDKNGYILYKGSCYGTLSGVQVPFQFRGTISTVPRCAIALIDNKLSFYTMTGGSFHISGFTSCEYFNKTTSKWVVYFPTVINGAYNVSVNIPVFSDLKSCENYLRYNILDNCVNYVSSKNWDDLIIDNDDLPFFGETDMVRNVARARDFGTIGGTVAGFNDWAEDIPSVYTGILDRILEGIYEKDDVITYDDAWADAIDKAVDIPKDSVIDNIIDSEISDSLINAHDKVNSDTNSGSEEGEGENNPDNSTNPKFTANLSKLFPFCIPFDLIHLIKVLKAEPKAPCFEIPINSKMFNINYTIVIDLKIFNSVASIFRLCEKILFILSLILITRNLIRG